MVGDEIKIFFANNNITQREAAKKLGVSNVMVNSLLSGKRNFGAKTAQGWHDAFGFGFRVNWLRTGEGPMMDNQEEEAEEPVIAEGLDKDWQVAMYEEILKDKERQIKELEEKNRELTERYYKKYGSQ